MLQGIRDKSQGIVVKIIVGFIAVTFALFGVDALVTGFGNTDKVAEIDGTEITRVDLLQMAEVQRRQLITAMGDQLNPALLDDNLLQRRALEELIQRTVLANNAEKLNLSVSDDQVNNYLLQAEQFKTDDKFDQARYLEFIRALGYSPLAFKQRIQQDLLIQQPRSVLVNSNFVLPNEVDQVSKLQNQQRTYDYIRLSLADEMENTQVSDVEIEKYYSEHASDFMLPEQVQLDYVILSSIDFHNKVSVTDAELDVAYQNAIATSPPEERLASHILIEENENRTKEEARLLAVDLKKQLDEGASFSSLAKKFSDDLGSKSSGGNLGYITTGSMVPEFENALFSLAVDQISDVVETEFGFHVIELREIIRPETPTFTQLESELRANLIEEKSKQAMLTAREDMIDLAYASDDLEPLAEEYETNIMHSDWFGRQGGDELISSNSEIVTSAFSAELLEDKLNSNLIELNDEQVAVVRVREHQPEAQKELSAAKNEILTVLLNTKATNSLIAEAETLKSNSVQGNWKTVDAASRGVDEVTTFAFQMAQPDSEPTIAVNTLRDGDIVLIRLKEVIEGAASADSTQRGYIERYLGQSNAELLTLAHQKALQSMSDIEQ